MADSMSESVQSRKATEMTGKFEKVKERLDAYQAKLNDPGTPAWEKKEMENKLSAMTQQLDQAVKRESSSEPPPAQGEAQEDKPPERPPQGTGGPQPSHVVTPVGGNKPEDKK